MNQRQINRLTMYRAVLQHFDAHTALWQALRPLQTGVAALRATLEAIDAQSRIQTAQQTGGYTLDKNEQRAHLCDLAYGVVLKLRPYARLTANHPLLAAIDHSRSDLERPPEAAVLLRCQAILDEGAENLTALTEYGLTQAELDALAAALEAFGPLTPERDRVQGERAAATATLPDLFEQAWEQVLILDDLVPALIGNAAFREAYTQVRRIDDR